MAKILNARDLLELAKQAESPAEFEAPDPMRRVYVGTPRAVAADRIPMIDVLPPVAPMGRRHTVKMEVPRPSLKLPAPPAEPTAEDAGARPKKADWGRRPSEPKLAAVRPEAPLPEALLPEPSPPEPPALHLSTMLSWATAPSPVIDRAPLELDDLRKTQELRVDNVDTEPTPLQSQRFDLGSSSFDHENTPTDPRSIPLPPNTEPNAVSYAEPVALTGDETLVLLNYDLDVSLDTLADRTGLTQYRVSSIVDKLHHRGVIEEVAPEHLRKVKARGHLEDAAREPTRSIEGDEGDEIEFAVSKPSADDEFGAPSRPSSDPKPEMAIARKEESPADDAPVSSKTSVDALNLELATTQEMPAPLSDDLALALSQYMSDAPLSAPKPTGPTASSTATPDETLAEATNEDVESTVVDEGGPPSDEKADSRSKKDDDAEEDESKDSLDAAANYQRHYHLHLENLTTDERAKIAAIGSGADLFALCYDMEPGVLRALFSNAGIGMEHARFAAFHHRTSFGLEQISDRGDFLRDPQVQRKLIRNPMLSERVLRRIVFSRRLIEIYKITLDRDVPERSRTATRGMLRQKFALADPEDRVQLIWNTEGRALASLTGCTLDSKATQLVCSRPIVSVMLVHNFVRFGATPPSIIAHCLKQPMIRRQIHLKNALLKHPNCPSEAKRAF